MLNHLETLSLVDNALSGSIPTEVAKLFRLHSFSLTANKMSGTVPGGLFGGGPSWVAATCGGHLGGARGLYPHQLPPPDDEDSCSSPAVYLSELALRHAADGAWLRIAEHFRLRRRLGGGGAPLDGRLRLLQRRGALPVRRVRLCSCELPSSCRASTSSTTACGDAADGARQHRARDPLEQHPSPRGGRPRASAPHQGASSRTTASRSLPLPRAPHRARDAPPPQQPDLRVDPRRAPRERGERRELRRARHRRRRHPQRARRLSAPVALPREQLRLRLGAAVARRVPHAHPPVVEPARQPDLGHDPARVEPARRRIADLPHNVPPQRRRRKGGRTHPRRPAPPRVPRADHGDAEADAAVADVPHLRVARRLPVLAEHPLPLWGTGRAAGRGDHPHDERWRRPAVRGHLHAIAGIRRRRPPRVLPHLQPPPDPRRRRRLVHGRLAAERVVAAAAPPRGRQRQRAPREGPQPRSRVHVGGRRRPVPGHALGARVGARRAFGGGDVRRRLPGCGLRVRGRCLRLRRRRDVWGRRFAHLLRGAAVAQADNARCGGGVVASPCTPPAAGRQHPTRHHLDAPRRTAAPRRPPLRRRTATPSRTPSASARASRERGGAGRVGAVGRG